eukprot:4208839-Alexandrium_andersonii.AAC.1
MPPLRAEHQGQLHPSEARPAGKRVFGHVAGFNPFDLHRVVCLGRQAARRLPHGCRRPASGNNRSGGASCHATHVPS